MSDLFSDNLQHEKRVFVHDLTIGASVESMFAVTRTSLREYERGKFLSVRLADKTGKIDAIQWDRAEVTYASIKDGDLVWVSGKVNSFRNTLQIAIKTIKRVEDTSNVDPSDFLPTCSTPLVKMTEEFDRIIEELNDEDCRRLLKAFREDESLWRKFSHAPAAKLWHHPYIHGLLEHSISVAKLCRLIAPFYPQVDLDLLICGAVFHDIGKIDELMFDFRVDYSTDGRLLGHIYIGLRIVEELIRRLDSFPEEKKRQLLHMVLSHHGEIERSPIVPMTLEATLLHHIENMDAQMMAITREMDNVRDDDGREWTGYVNLIQRYLYLGQTDSDGENSE